MAMLWLEKLYMVGIFVDVYAMVGIDANLGYRRSDNRRLDKRSSTNNISPKACNIQNIWGPVLNDLTVSIHRAMDMTQY